MSKLSAGIIAYRIINGEVEVLLVHPGGPFFKNKDAGTWSIPKGEYVEGEDALLAAKREFEEETGNVLPDHKLIQLSSVKIKSGKVISAWAIEADFDTSSMHSNLFEIEWPPRSGKKKSFPEIDKAGWFSLKEARQKINSGQIDFLDQLEIVFKNDE